MSRQDSTFSQHDDKVDGSGHKADNQDEKEDDDCKDRATGKVYREKLEREIYDILDEIMILLGTVSAPSTAAKNDDNSAVSEDIENNFTFNQSKETEADQNECFKMDEDKAATNSDPTPSPSVDIAQLDTAKRLREAFANRSLGQANWVDPQFLKYLLKGALSEDSSLDIDDDDRHASSDANYNLNNDETVLTEDDNADNNVIGDVSMKSEEIDLTEQEEITDAPQTSEEQYAGCIGIKKTETYETNLYNVIQEQEQNTQLEQHKTQKEQKEPKRLISDKENHFEDKEYLETSEGEFQKLHTDCKQQQNKSKQDSFFHSTQKELITPSTSSNEREMVDSEQSILYRLQTLYYVDQFGNRKMTEVQRDDEKYKVDVVEDHNVIQEKSELTVKHQSSYYEAFESSQSISSIIHHTNTLAQESTFEQEYEMSNNIISSESLLQQHSGYDELFETSSDTFFDSAAAAFIDSSDICFGERQAKEVADKIDNEALEATDFSTSESPNQSFFSYQENPQTISNETNNYENDYDLEKELVIQESTSLNYSYETGKIKPAGSETEDCIHKTPFSLDSQFGEDDISKQDIEHDLDISTNDSNLTENYRHITEFKYDDNKIERKESNNIVTVSSNDIAKCEDFYHSSSDSVNEIADVYDSRHEENTDFFCGISEVSGSFPQGLLCDKSVTVISQENVPMAEVDVAMEDFKKYTNSALASSDNEASTIRLHGISRSIDSSCSVEGEIQERKRIPSLYERSISAKLSRAMSDDPSKWSLTAESDLRTDSPSFTFDSTKIDEIQFEDEHSSPKDEEKNKFTPTRSNSEGSCDTDEQVTCVKISKSKKRRLRKAKIKALARKQLEAENGELSLYREEIDYSEQLKLTEDSSPSTNIASTNQSCETLIQNQEKSMLDDNNDYICEEFITSIDQTNDANDDNEYQRESSQVHEPSRQLKGYSPDESNQRRGRSKLKRKLIPHGATKPTLFALNVTQQDSDIALEGEIDPECSEFIMTSNRLFTTEQFISVPQIAISEYPDDSQTVVTQYEQTTKEGNHSVHQDNSLFLGVPGQARRRSRSSSKSATRKSRSRSPGVHAPSLRSITGSSPKRKHRKNIVVVHNPKRF